MFRLQQLNENWPYKGTRNDNQPWLLKNKFIINKKSSELSLSFSSEQNAIMPLFMNLVFSSH